MFIDPSVTSPLAPSNGAEQELRSIDISHPNGMKPALRDLERSCNPSNLAQETRS